MESSLILDSKGKIGLKPSVSQFTSNNNDSLFVKHKNKLFKISATADLQKQSRIFQILKRPKKLGEILYLLSEFKKKDVIDTLHTLHKLDLLTIESNTNNLRSESRPVDNDYLPQHHIERKSKRLRAKPRLLLIGDGILADKLVLSLKNMDIKFNRISSNLIMNKSHKKRYPNQTNGNNRSSIKSTYSSSLRSFIEKSYLIVVAEDHPNLVLFEKINETCFKKNKPWLRASFDDSIGYLGPLVIPKKTSCFNCCELRLVTNSPHYEYELWINRQNIPKKKLLVPAYYADILSTMCIDEILRFLSIRKKPETIDKLVILDTQQINATRHNVIPHPNCVYCNPPPRKMRSSSSREMNATRSRRIPVPFSKLSNKSSSLPDKELVGKLREIIDDKTGIVLEYSKLYEPHPLGIYFHHFSTAPCSKPLRIGLNGKFTKTVRVEDSLISPSPSGSGFSPTEAEIHTLMESVERYSNMVVDESRFIWSKYDQIKTRAINPEVLGLYSDEQYSRNDLGCSKFSIYSPIPWIEGYDIHDDKPVMIPADFVFYPAIREKPLVFDTSNGASAHTDIVQAILNGLFEVVERDSFLTMWLNGFSMPILNLKKLPFGFSKSIELINEFGMNVKLVDLTNDTRIPTVAAICYNNNPSKHPSVLVGAGSHIQPETAVQKALFEMEFMLSEMLEHPNKKKINRPNQISSMYEHPLYYLNPKMRKYWDFMISSKETTDFPRVSKSPKQGYATLMQIVRLLHSMNHRVIYVDITSPELKKMGLVAVKVLVTGFQPLYVGTKLRLNIQRLHEAAEYVSRNIKATRMHPGLNPAPHPLP